MILERLIHERIIKMKKYIILIKNNLYFVNNIGQVIIIKLYASEYIINNEENIDYP